MITTYVVMKYWKGSYCSGWVEACEKRSLEEAHAFIQKYLEPFNKSYKIIHIQESVIAEHYDVDITQQKG